MPQSLDQLLKDTDAGAIVSPPSEDLPSRVRRAHLHQRRRLRIAQASVGAIVIIAAFLTIPRPHTRQTHPVAIKPAPSVPEHFEAELASLDLTARVHERIADELIANRNPRPQRAITRLHDPTLAMLQQQRDRAALLLVYEADQYRKQNDPQQATAAYQRTIELFPQSHWANIARQRLKGTS
jgi:hypothetical protein